MTSARLPLKRLRRCQKAAVHGPNLYSAVVAVFQRHSSPAPVTKPKEFRATHRFTRSRQDCFVGVGGFHLHAEQFALMEVTEGSCTGRIGTFRKHEAHRFEVADVTIVPAIQIANPSQLVAGNCGMFSIPRTALSPGSFTTLCRKCRTFDGFHYMTAHL